MKCEERCPFGPRVSCDLDREHLSPHHTWWQDGFGEFTVSWTTS